MAEPRRHSFPKSHHLRSPKAFDAVYAAKTRESRGPVTVYARPNDLGHPRLGLSVSRKVGNAVRRNRIRRLLRAAVRLMQHDLPRGYDLVVVVRPHEPLMLADYQRALSGAAVRLHRKWQERPAARPVSAAGRPPANDGPDAPDAAGRRAT
jgi:ribonuclease P protein component